MEKIVNNRAVSQRDEKQKDVKVPTTTVLGSLGLTSLEVTRRGDLKLQMKREKEDRKFLKAMEEVKLNHSKAVKSYLKRQEHRDVVVKKMINAKLKTQLGVETKAVISKKLHKHKSKYNDLAIDKARDSKFDLFHACYEATSGKVGASLDDEDIHQSTHYVLPDDYQRKVSEGSAEADRVLKEFLRDHPHSPSKSPSSCSAYGDLDDELTIPWLMKDMCHEQIENFKRKWKNGGSTIQVMANDAVLDVVESQDTIMMHLEKFCLLIVNLRGCASIVEGKRQYNVAACLSALWMWLRTYTPALSISHLIGSHQYVDVMRYLLNLCHASYMVFSTGLEFMFALFGMHNYEGTADFKAVLSSPLMTDCANLFAEIGATGLMAAMGLWSPEFNKWYHEVFVWRAKNSTNILTMTIDIISQLVEGGQLFWKSGDFKDIFCANNLREVQVELLQHRADSAFAVADGGSPDSVSGLYERIGKTMDKIAKVSLYYGPVHRYTPAINKMREELTKITNDIKTIMKKGTIRVTPVVFELFGPPGVGKSILLYDLVYLILRMTGVPNPTIGMVSHINESDKFDSTIHNGTRAIVLDDIGAIRQGVLDGPPMITKLINFVNSVPSPSHQAELSNKGAIYPMPHVIGITTNIKDMLIADSMNVPEATARRTPIVISFIVPAALCITGTSKLDNSKLDRSRDIHHQLLYVIEVRRICPKTAKLLPFRRHYTTNYGMPGQKGIFPMLELEDGFGNKALSYESMMIVFRDISLEMWDRSVEYRDHIEGVMKTRGCPKCHLPITMSCCACTYGGLNVEVVPSVASLSTDEKLSYEGTMIWPSAGQASLMILVPPISAIFLYFVPVHKTMLYPFNVVNYYQKKVQYKIMGAVKGVNFLEKVMEVEDDLRSLEDNLGAEAFKVFTTKRTFVRFLAMASVALAAYKTYQFVSNYMSFKGDSNDGEGKKTKSTHEATIVKTMLGQQVDIVLPPVESIKPYLYPTEYKTDRVPYSSDITKGLTEPMVNTTYGALLTKLAKSSFLIIIDGGQFNGFFLKDQIFVTVAHGFPPKFFSEEGVVVSIILTNQFTTTSPIEIEKQQVYRGDGDIVYINMSPVNRYADLTKYCRVFKTGEVILPEVTAVSLEMENSVIRHKSNRLYNGRYMEVGVNISAYKSHVITKGYEFDGMMARGSSGCPVILINGHTASIIGIQSAIDKGTSMMQRLENIDFSTLMTKFDVDDILQAQVEQYIDVPITDKPGAYSVAQHLEGSAISYVGTLIEHHPVRNKTSFRHSIFYPYIVKDGLFYDRERLITSDKYVIPELSPYTITDDSGNKRWVSHKLVGVGQAATADVVEICQTMIDVCHADYMSAITKLKFPKIDGPVSLSDVLNGAEGVKKINVKASAGFYHRGLIKDMLDGSEGSYTLKPEIQIQYDLLEKQIYSRRAPYQCVTVNVKDEIVKESKLASLRVFMCFPALFTILCKRYLTPLLNIILAHPDAFEVALGINALGKSWTQMIGVLFQRKYILDGDYKKYDKKQMRRILLSFKRMIAYLCIQSNYPGWCTMMCLCLIDMMIYHVIVVGADLFELFRSLPSGCLLTIFFNCYVNSMYFRIAWFSKFEGDFRTMNSLRTYGDDALNGTNCADFNMQMISSELAKYGVTFTAASKEDSNLPFSTPEKITFLKRGFKKTLLSDGQFYYLCPLAEASIFKMLAFTDASVGDEPLIMCANLIDAQKQYWFYGRDMFEHMTILLRDIAVKANVSGGIGECDSAKKLRWFTYEQIEAQYLGGTLQIQFL